LENSLWLWIFFKKSPNSSACSTCRAGRKSEHPTEHSQAVRDLECGPLRAGLRACAGGRAQPSFETNHGRTVFEGSVSWNPSVGGDISAGLWGEGEPQDAPEVTSGDGDRDIVVPEEDEPARVQRKELFYKISETEFEISYTSDC
jgi:hypothetical protein